MESSHVSFWNQLELYLFPLFRGTSRRLFREGHYLLSQGIFCCVPALSFSSIHTAGRVCHVPGQICLALTNQIAIFA